VNQEEISDRSLRNAMDSPREAAIRFFMEKWKDYMEKAENLIYIN
jgi:hypothetical protein